MTDADYVAFCNFAFGQRQAAEAFCAALDDEEARQLDGLVRMELSASGEKIEPAYDFLAALLAAEVEERDNPQYQLAAPAKGGSDDLPF